MTRKTKLVIHLLFVFFLLGTAFISLKPVDMVGLQVSTDQTDTAHLFNQVEGEVTLSSLHSSNTTKYQTDLPGPKPFQDRPDGCRKKNYKKDVITVPCGNGWGG